MMGPCQVDVLFAVHRVASAQHGKDRLHILGQDVSDQQEN
jgi:hypothetical protein